MKIPKPLSTNPFALFCLIFLGVSLLLVGVSCSQKECFSPPASFRLILHDIGGNDLSCTESIVLYKGENMTGIDILKQIWIDTSVNPSDTICFLESDEVAWESSTGSKLFYLDINNNRDTLMIDVVEQNDNNCTFFRYNEVSYNGHILAMPNNKVGAYEVVQEP